MMPNCQACNGSVSESFVRVFGRDGEVWGCPDCLTHSEIQAGEAAIPPTEPEVDDDVSRLYREREQR